MARQKRQTVLPENSGLTLVIGGARSGKSKHAESLIGSLDPPWIYVATAEAHDSEMQERIDAHRLRRDMRWQTVEAPLKLAETLKDLPANRAALVDCLTLWLSNHLLADHDLDGECEALVGALAARTSPTIVVTNEVGQGIVPGDPLSRRFRDAAGKLNQKVASVAGRVILMVAGIPMQVK